MAPYGGGIASLAGQGQFASSIRHNCHKTETIRKAGSSTAVTSNKGVVHMRVGVGLPNGIPGTNGQLIIEWAQRADKGPFSSLGVIDRLVYDSYDPLIAL